MTMPANYTTLVSRAKLAILTLWAVVAMTGSMLLLDLGEAAGLFSQLTMGDGLAAIYVFVGIGYTAAFLASVLSVAMWIHRAHANLHEVGIEGLEFTPGWAVGWYFVPFAKLVKPFHAMRELRNASMGDAESFTDEPPSQLKFWWGCWLGGNIISNINTRMVNAASDPTSLQFAAIFGILSDGLIIAAAWFLTGIIRDITNGQATGKSQAEVFS